MQGLPLRLGPRRPPPATPPEHGGAAPNACSEGHSPPRPTPSQCRPKHHPPRRGPSQDPPLTCSMKARASPAPPRPIPRPTPHLLNEGRQLRRPLLAVGVVGHGLGREAKAQQAHGVDAEALRQLRHLRRPPLEHAGRCHHNRITAMRPGVRMEEASERDGRGSEANAAATPGAPAGACWRPVGATSPPHLVAPVVGAGAVAVHQHDGRCVLRRAALRRSGVRAMSRHPRRGPPSS